MLGACLFPQALERELAPVEERLSKLEQMARKVVRVSSTEGREVNERKAEINALWDKLKVCMCVRDCVPVCTASTLMHPPTLHTISD